MDFHTTLRLFLFCLFIPYPSKQHFVWPLHWCLLADICNHTWIPECGAEDDIPTNRKLFTDECDMYEYNCDFERDFEPINYSDCFNLPIKECPPVIPCPAVPPCPGHKLNKKKDKFIATNAPVSVRRWGFRRPTTLTSVPKHMLRGKRRYTPWRIRYMKDSESKSKATYTTVLVKKEEVIRNGKRMMKPPSYCLLSKFCNHTGIPLCGEHKEKEKRKFLDECDMFEFNCDYHKEFKPMDKEECDTITSSTITTEVITESTVNNSPSSTLRETDNSSSSSTTESTTITNFSSTEVATPSSTPSTIETTTLDSNLSATEYTTVATTAFTTIQSTSSTPSTIETTITTLNTPECILPSTISTTTEIPTISTTQITLSSIITPETTSVSTSTEGATVKEPTESDIKTTIPYTCTSSLITVDTKSPSTTKVVPTLSTVTDITNLTTQSIPVTCSLYPKECNRPVTWETTSKGETRDFYQILREKYGNRIRLLRATTHWSPSPGVISSFNEENFQFGRHNES